MDLSSHTGGGWLCMPQHSLLAREVVALSSTWAFWWHWIRTLTMAQSRLQLYPENWVWCWQWAINYCCDDIMALMFFVSRGGTTGSHNHKMSWCGRDHKNHLISTTPPWAGMPPTRSDCPRLTSSLASENNLLPSSREPSSASRGSGSITSLWEGSVAAGGLTFSLSHAYCTPVPNLCIFFWMWTITKLLNTCVRKEIFSDISALTNRWKEKQAAFFLLCSCHRIVPVDNVSDVSDCVILGKGSRKKKGLSQNPHARLFYTFSSWASHKFSQEIKAVA